MIESFRGQELDAHYLGFFDCFNRQLFYEAHDVLEDLWLPDRQGVDGNFYKGLIQLAGAFVHLQKNRLRPSAALFKLAQANLSKYPGVHHRLDQAVVLGLIAGWLQRLEQGGFGMNPLTAQCVPVLNLLPYDNMNRQRILLAGGSGFIGTALARELIRQNYEVIVLTRSPRPRSDGVREVAWDGRSAGEWAGLLDGALAVVNLTGKNINCPHTAANVGEIASSRVDSVKALAAAVGRVQMPPRAWVQASATGFYGDAQDRVCAEAAPAGTGALAGICRDWEAAFAAAPLPATRRVVLRIGFVLGREGGALPVLSGLTKWFLGGAAGNGRQYISWIHLADLVQMMVAVIVHDRFAGVFNAVAPDPVTNAVFMGALRRTLRRPWSPPAPAFAVQLGARLMGSEPALVLAGQRCAPENFLRAGFAFQFPQLRPALEDLCRG